MQRSRDRDLTLAADVNDAPRASGSNEPPMAVREYG